MSFPQPAPQLRVAEPAEPAAPLVAKKTLPWRLLSWLRVLVALCLIVLSLWSLLLPVSLPISSNAAITARVAIVSTPMRGEIRSLAADVGDRVRAGLPVAEVGKADTFIDDVDKLRVERANVEAQRTAVAAELKQSTIVRARYDARYRDYSTRIVKESESLAVEAQRKHDALLANKRAKAALVERLREEKAPLDTALLELEAADKALTLAETTLARSRVHVEDAKAGYYLALGFEPPQMSGLPADLELRVARLEAEKARLDGAALTLDSEILEAEKGRRASALKVIESPVNGVVWARPVNVGQFVEPGADLYRIADQRTLHVQAYFHRRYLEGMAIGNKASIYLVAARRVVKGTVKVIQALDAGKGHDELAVDLPAPDDDHFKVVIELDEEGRKMAEIGGLAKVAVVGSIENGVQRAMMWLYLRFES